MTRGAAAMAEPTDITTKSADLSPAAQAITEAPVEAGKEPAFQPFVPDAAHLHEFTWPAVLLGTVTVVPGRPVICSRPW